MQSSSSFNAFLNQSSTSYSRLRKLLISQDPEDHQVSSSSYSKQRIGQTKQQQPISFINTLLSSLPLNESEGKKTPTLKDQLDTILKDKDSTISSSNHNQGPLNQSSNILLIEDQQKREEGEGSSDEMSESMPTIQSQYSHDKFSKQVLLKPAIINQTVKSPSQVEGEDASFYKLNST